jgi:hypothetical protein
LALKALMVDVDGVLVDGRPEDGRHWTTSLEEDLGFSRDGEELLLIDDRRENTDAALKAGWQTLDWTKDSSPGILRSLWR